MQKGTGFKQALRRQVRFLFKEMRGNGMLSESGFQKMRLEVSNDKQMRVSLTRTGETKPAITFTGSFAGATKEEAVKWSMSILGNAVRAKSPDDFQIVDSDAPENSAALQKIGMKNVLIVGRSSITNVTFLGEER
jgi:hypothetical protein